MNTPSENPSVEYETIGYIDVDSGGIIISDPCYLFDQKDRPTQHALTAIRKHGSSSCITTTTKLPSLIITNGFGGDGTYPVLARKNQWGRIEEIVIKFSRGHDYEAEIEEELMLDMLYELELVDADGNLLNEDEEE